MTTTVLPPSTNWSMRDAGRVFAQLSAPDLQELAGRWDGAFIGRPSLQRLTTAIAATGPLRAWCGKDIGPSGDVHNLVRRRGATKESVRAAAARGSSLLDGQPAVIVDYSKTAKPPVSWVRGELRWLRPGQEILGLLIFPLRKHPIGPFPFRLTRSGQAAGEVAPARLCGPPVRWTTLPCLGLASSPDEVIGHM
jgi:hypothetical protein